MPRITFVAFMMLSTVCLADHLPPNLIAKGQPETVLGGIDVIHSTLSDLQKKFGEPQSYKKYPETEEAGEIIWIRDGSRIHATIHTDNIAYAVDVSGKPSPVAKTGRGLGLGQSLADVRRVYGSRFWQHGKNGNEILVQWEDGTELRIRLSSGRISSLELVAPVE